MEMGIDGLEQDIASALFGLIGFSDLTIDQIITTVRSMPLEEMMQVMYHERQELLRKQKEERDNQIAPCDFCGKTLRYGDTYKGDMQVAWSIIGPFFHACPICIDAKVQARQRTCDVCGAVFRLQASNLTSNVCNNCRSPRYSHEAHKVNSQNLRTQALGLPSSLALGEWVKTLDHFSWRCAYCQMAAYEDLEHFIPITQNGGTTAGNCVPACKPCNGRKHSHHPDSPLQPIAGVDIARVAAYLATR